ncbi:hypothetical protein INS49_000153 [Diaporthe citri]|uniref:uncharacterized protein n=1 Tax=Diaporthe citri TaxID=83186 RepID=UPI001C7E40D9|nr:uncharacterized protein INS49_000153 [Diaporthe citri]KAG6365977.1 hypothetical protein INS49_000153 [Diaporthe citri]
MFLEPGQEWSPSTSWVPPPLDRLNWSDCYAIGNFVAAAGLEQRFDRIPVNTTVPFARSLVPADWPDSPPSPATLLIWAWSWQNTTSPENAITGTAWSMAPTCIHQMMFTYYLIATMATAYPLILGSAAVGLFNRTSRLARIVGWFRETISGFLDASLIFAVALVVAATYRFSSALRYPDQLDNAFSPSLWNAIIVALLSVSPPLILQCASGDTLRRKGLRLLLWSLVVVFTTTSSILFFFWYRSLKFSGLPTSTRTTSIQYLWNLCTKNLPKRVHQNLGFVVAAQTQLLLNLILWAYTKLSKSGSAPDRRTTTTGYGGVQKTQARAINSHGSPRLMSVFQLRALQAFSAQLMMWLLLGRLTSLTLSDGVNAGDSFKNVKWSVGQVLGLAQFVPVVIDLVVAGTYGPKAAWEEKMSKRLSVVDAPPASGDSGGGDATNKLAKSTTM